MTLEFHDPRGASRVAPEPYTCAAALEGAATIGLLANNFPDSVPFLDAVERALSTALPAVRFARFVKNSASIPADRKLIAEIAARCDALVTAYGH